jgi:hypothetical protein
MEVICLEDEAFFALVKKVVAQIRQEQNIQEDKWIGTEEAMRKLRITSKTTLQNLRNNGLIRFSQPQRKIILYDTDSINEYLLKHARNTF